MDESSTARAGSGDADAAARLARVRELVSTATRRLLGDTIGLTEEDWRQPSRLPGWSRGHVATHIARQADALDRLASWAATGRRQAMYPSAEARAADIEAGAGRSAVELQTDLDEAAQALGKGFAAVDRADAWDAEVELRGGSVVPARVLPLGRLAEVVLHHVDLDVGWEVEHVDVESADLMLRWVGLRLGSHAGVPRIRLSSTSGLVVNIGAGGSPREVRGASTDLLGWLSGRRAPAGLEGAEGLQPPPL